MLRRVLNYTINAFKQILRLFLHLLFALRDPLICLAMCFLIPVVIVLTSAVLGQTFVPFGLAAVCIPFCYYAHQGIISLVQFCGYRIVDSYEERWRIDRERSPLLAQRFNQNNHYSNQFIGAKNPVLHGFRNLNREASAETAQSVPVGGFDQNLRNNLSMG